MPLARCWPTRMAHFTILFFTIFSPSALTRTRKKPYNCGLFLDSSAGRATDC